MRTLIGYEKLSLCMEELETPLEVLKQTEEGDDVEIHLQDDPVPIRTLVKQHYDGYENARNQKWELNSVQIIVFHDLQTQVKQLDKDGFLSSPGKKVTKIINGTKEVMATNEE